MTTPNDLISRFLLLAHHPTKGGYLVSNIARNYGLAGALLLEMHDLGLIRVESNRLYLVEGAEAKPRQVADVLEMIRLSKKPRKIRYWIQRVEQRASAYRRAWEERLAAEGVYSVEHRRFLGLIPYRKTYLTDRRIREALVADLRAKVLQGAAITAEDYSLLALLRACKMDRFLAEDRQSRKRIGRELKGLLSNSPIAQGVESAVQGVEAAFMGAMVCVVIASI